MINDLLYADDTLLIGCKPHILEKFMAVIADLGKCYGLELNWKKVEAMSSKSSDVIRGADGYEIDMKESVVYLGASISIDGSISSEISRRLGMAQQDFKALSKIWNKISISRYRKLELLSACIFSKLLYGLQTAWLSKYQRIRFDGF